MFPKKNFVQHASHYPTLPEHTTFFIPVVLGPLNSLVWYVPSSRYTRGLGWRMHCGAEVTESSTDKEHHPPKKIGRLKVGSKIKSRCQVSKKRPTGTTCFLREHIGTPKSFAHDSVQSWPRWPITIVSRASY